jgi:hypothetical protein
LGGELDTASVLRDSSRASPIGISRSSFRQFRKRQSLQRPHQPEGKATVSENRRTHGLSGRFTLLSWENAAEFAQLCESLLAEHQPANDTELRLVDSIAQHYWLSQRALHLQNQLLEAAVLDHRTFSLYLRYQTTNERAYFRAMRELQTLRKEKRQREIGFES